MMRQRRKNWLRALKLLARSNNEEVTQLYAYIVGHRHYRDTPF